MALLDDLISAIQNKALNADGSLTLTPADFNNTFTADWFTNVLQVQSITLASAQRALNNNVLTVSGNSVMWNVVTSLNVALTFSADADNNVTIAVAASYPAANTVQLQIIPWLQMTNISINSDFLQPDEITDFGYSCTLQAAGHPGIPVTIMQTGVSTWHIEIAENATQAVTANDVVALLGGNSLESFLPQLLINILSGLNVNGFTGTFDTQANAVPFLQAAFTVTNGWNIAPNVSLLPGLQLSLTLINGNDSSARAFAALVSGTFMLGSTSVPIMIGANVGTVDTWTFGVQPGETVTLPSFSDLLQLAGNDFYNSLPSGLKDLPTILISTFEVDFDSTNQVLNEINFEVSTGSTWAVLPGYFEIYKLQIAFDITNVNVPANRDVTGTVNATFKLGTGLFLMCSIVKDDSNPDWTITAGLPPNQPVNISQLATALFENKVVVPSNIPEIIFTTLQTSVTPSQGVFALNAASTDTWTIFGDFAVNGFNLNISRAATPGNPITGSISTQLQIAGVNVILSASLSNVAGAGWQFTGLTQPGQTIGIGQLISYLTSTFGIGTPPQWLSGISLQNLYINFNTSPSAAIYQFHVTGNIPIADQTFQVAIGFDMHAGPSGGFTKSLSGTITVNATTFMLAFDSSTTDSKFTASWSAANPSANLQLSAIVSALGITLPGTDALDLSLKSITLIYDFTQKAFVLEAQSASYGNAAFASYLDAASTRQYYFGMNVSGAINLSNLPLVDRILPSGDTLQIEQMQAVISSVAVTSPEAIAQLNTILGANAPQVPDSGIQQTVQFSMAFAFGDTQLPVSIGFGSNASDSLRSNQNANVTTASANSLSSQTSSDGSQWFNVQRSFGPLSVNRAGIKYKSNVISILLDASLAMGGLDVSVMGLAVGMNITDFEPEFNIDGLGVSYSNPALQLGGAFLKVDPPQSPATLQFAGGVVVGTEKFSVAAYGEYAQIPSGTSMFMFASVSYPFGGPPFFFITGFCGGFGYNSSLRLPAMDEVYQFPFVAGLTDPSQVGGTGASPLQVIAVISGQTGQPAWVSPQAGEMWAAVGIQFSTFSIINSTALLTAIFGNDFKLALIGLSKASFPMGASSPYAYVELELEAIFDPGDGVISFTAILSPNSYVLDPACHLTGGFAMFFWYGNNEHAGDFVVSLGGYSHYFSPPSWYPQLDRLGFNWSLDSSISITGGSYFALTPSALMAGGALSAVYSSGNLSAWFTAHADIVIWWNPFHFVAEIGISVGASYKMDLLFTSVTMRVEMGADLTLWGPPTGGTVTVHWWVISFTIDFGSDQSTGLDKQQWSDFNQVLPAPGDAVKFTAVRGLSAAQQNQQAGSKRLMGASVGDDQSQNWLVRGDKFQFVTDASVPVSDLYIGKESTTSVQSGSQLNIRPMQATSLSSSHCVYLQLANGTEIDMLDPQGPWTWTANTKNVPNALWGTGDNKSLSSGTDQLVPGQLTGMIFTAPAPVTGYTPGIATLQNLGQDPLEPGTNPLKTGQAASGPVPQLSTTTIQQITQISQQQTNRTGIASALQALGVAVNNDNPVNLGKNAGSLFSDEPMIINTSSLASGERFIKTQPGNGPSVLLDYSFNINPDPIQVSPAEGNPNMVSISITVSNGRTEAITCNSIVFGFNIGDLAQDLTASDKNMHWSVLTGTLQPNSQWTIAAIGQGQFKATPVKPQYGVFSEQGVVFRFFDIKVNTEIGTTPLNITETTKAQTAFAEKKFGKFPNNFSMGNFKATPNTIKIGESTMLSWDGSQNANYMLTWGDRNERVTNLRKFPVERLLRNTTFYLTASVAKDGQTAERTLTFPVTVLGVSVLSFSPDSSTIDLGKSVKLSWASENADHCLLVPAMDTPQLPPNGNVSITPTLYQRVFSISAFDKNRDTFAASPFVTIQFNKGVINVFRANPPVTYPGGTVVFTWAITSALYPSISSIGIVSGNSASTQVYANSTFVLTCQEEKGPITEKADVSVVPLVQYLIGKSYALYNQVNYYLYQSSMPIAVHTTNDLIVFTSANEAVYSWNYQEDDWDRYETSRASQTYKCTWSLNGNTLLLTYGFAAFFAFTFNPATNTFYFQNPPDINGVMDSGMHFYASGTQMRPNRNFTERALSLVHADHIAHHFFTKHKAHNIFRTKHRHLMMVSNNIADTSVLLNYTFTSNPDPIQVSPVSGNPNAAKISIAVSAGDVAVNCTSITFSFNVGTFAQDLTTDDSSIHWSVMSGGQQSTQWTIAALGQGQFQATPVKPEYGTLTTQGIVFVFFDINVNTEVGTTPLTITEVTTSQTAYLTQPFGKFPGGFSFGNFTTVDQVVAVGGSATMTWDGSQNATYAISWGTQSFDVTNVRSYTITELVANPTTVYLTATVQGAKSTLTFPITVLGVTVNSFTPDNSTVNLGDSVTFTWATSNADHCKLVPPMGTTQLPANGSVTITPTLNNSTFSIEAFDKEELTFTSSKPVTIIFNSGVINSFVANPSRTYPGGTVTLSWGITSALFPSISSIGIVTGNSISTVVQQDNTFVLTCQAVQGPITNTAPVTVVPVAEYLVGTTYGLSNTENQYYGGTPDGDPIDVQTVVDTLVFTSATTATYSWNYVDNDYDEMQTSTASQSFPGTWSLSGNTVSLVSGTNVFTFIFNPANNTLAFQNPQDVTGVGPDGVAFISQTIYLRTNLNFTLQSTSLMMSMRKSIGAPLRNIANAMPASPVVLLDYSESSTPGSITVSPAQGAPSTASITINVSNSSGVAVTCSSIMFSFEVDQLDTSSGLTTDDSSIHWNVLNSDGNATQEWQIAWLGQGQFKATPAKPEYGTITTQGYSFMFFDINVNKGVGTTPLIITENSMNQTAYQTIYIGKFEPGFIFENFKATPNTVVVGTGTTLTWNLAGNAIVKLNWGTKNSINVTNLNAYPVKPADLPESTTFYLTATATENGQTIEQTLFFPVTVLPVKVDTFTAVSVPPAVNANSSVNDSIQINLGDSIQLTWTTENTDHCRLVPPIGTEQLPASGSATVTPTVYDTSITIYAFTPDESESAQAQSPISILFNPGVINSFRSDYPATYQNGPITLYWGLTSAYSPSITPYIGDVSGNSIVIPNVAAQTTFVLSCLGVQGTVTASVTIPIVPIETYLVGKQYSPMYMGDALPITFVSSTLAYMWFNTFPWTFSDNNILVSAFGYYAAFIFDPATNTLSVNYPAFTAIVLTGTNAFSSKSLKSAYQKKVMMLGMAQSPATTPSVLLDYKVNTTPNPIEASVDGFPSNVASITIDIANDGYEPITCTSITFNFNVGNLAQDLTTDDTSITWVVVPETQWQIAAQGQGVFVATPIKPEYATIQGGGLSFQFSNINVNDQVGPTPLIIQEVTSTQTAFKTEFIDKSPSQFEMDDFQSLTGDVPVGNDVVLTWNGAPGVYKLSWDDQTVDVSDVRTYTYKNLVKNEMFYLSGTGMKDGESITIVLPFQVIMLPAKVDTFTASALTINLGDSVTFTYSTECADHCYLTPAMGTAKLGANGTVSVVPTLSSNQFYLTAYDTNEVTHGSSDTITIGFNNAVINSFTANPGSLSFGDTVTLSWSVTSATMVSISGIGPVTGNSITVVQHQNTTYTLSCVGVQGTITQPLFVPINGIDPLLIGNTFIINPGGEFTLTITFLDSANLSVVVGNVPPVTMPYSIAGNIIAGAYGGEYMYLLYDPASNTISEYPYQVPSVPAGGISSYLIGNTFVLASAYGETVSVKFIDSANLYLFLNNASPITMSYTIAGDIIAIAYEGNFAYLSYNADSNTVSVNYNNNLTGGLAVLQQDVSAPVDPKKKLLSTMLQSVSPIPSVLLGYKVYTSPDPIEASVIGFAPNIASITIDVANDGFTPVTCTSITFNFSVGDTGQDLTPDDTSMTWIVTPETEWQLAAQGQGVFIATPIKPEYALIAGGGLAFQFSNINVNDKTGVTLLVIQEVTSTQTASITESIGKSPSEFEMDDFQSLTGDVPVGNDVVLTWNGAPGVYKLSWDDQTVDVSNVRTYTFKNLVKNEMFYLNGTGIKNGASITIVLPFQVIMLPAKVDTFSASALTINLGDSVTFTFTTECADHCYLSPAMNTSELGATGTVSVVPTLSANQFYLTAYDTNEVTHGESATITIGFNNAVINSFTADQPSVYIGNTVTLSWSVTSATMVSISGIGPVTGNSITVVVTQPTTYTLSCVGVQGTISQNVFVNATVETQAEKLVGRTFVVPDPGNYISDYYTTYTIYFSSINGGTYTYDQQPDYIHQYPQSWSASWSIDGNNLITVSCNNGPTILFSYNASVDMMFLYSPPPPPGPQNNDNDPFDDGGNGIDGGGSGRNIN